MRKGLSHKKSKRNERTEAELEAKPRRSKKNPTKYKTFEGEEIE